MTWRSVMISRPAKLSRKHFSLAIEQEETLFVPFEDIAVIVLDNPQIVITHPVLSACAEYGISLFSTGETHQPNGVFLPFLTHSRATRQFHLQLTAARPLQKRLWSEIIKSKISNQSLCLSLSAASGAEELLSFQRRVRSGDTDNMEAQAAYVYFRRLFGKDFSRAESSDINSYLDYGYAILRGAIARGLVAHGLFPSWGIFHSNVQNAFNLADDFIEPFRPLVDLYVKKHLSQTSGPLTTSTKAELIKLLNFDVKMAQGKMPVLTAIEYMTESFVRILEGSEEKLDLPVLIKLKEHVRDF